MFSNYPITKKRKVEKFMEPTGTFTYYEDSYGRRNRDEADEGPVHSCKSDSDEETTRKSLKRPSPDRFFRKYTTPKSKSSGSNHFGTIRTPGKQTTLSTLQPFAIDTDTSRSPSKRPRASTSNKKHHTRKYGVSGDSATNMGEPNSAGEFLEDLLGPRAGSGAEYFNTLEPDTASEADDVRKDTPVSEPIRSEIQRSPRQVNKPAALGADDMYDETLEAEQNADVRSASEGDIEDNDSELNEELKKEARSLRSRRPCAGAKKPIMATNKSRPAQPTYSLRKNALKRAATTSSHAGTPRRSAHHVKAEKPQSADRGVGRSRAIKAKQLAASNRSKMTARAVTLRKKAKKIDKGGKAAAEDEYYQAVYGRKSNGKKRQEMDNTTDEKEEYYRAVYGRKAKAKAEDILEQYEYEPEFTNVIPSIVAKVMEKMGGRVEVDVGEVEDVDAYERMF